MEKNAGKVAAKVTDACTHLITTQKDFTSQSSKGILLTFRIIMMVLIIELTPLCLALPSYHHLMKSFNNSLHNLQ